MSGYTLVRLSAPLSKYSEAAVSDVLYSFDPAFDSSVDGFLTERSISMKKRCECRTYLRRERSETVASLAEAYSITEDEVMAAVAPAEAKAAEAEARGDLFHGYGPMYPDPDESIDWRRCQFASTAS
jgi:hypothetical protein